MSRAGYGLSAGGRKAPQEHNSEAAIAVKVELREGVLAALAERGVAAHVFDAYCGPEGAMFDRVWYRAASYVGCDQEMVWPDRRRRFVGDNRRVLRAVDLSPYNVFDFDAFGSPWEQMVILAARRTWSPGEVGAVVLTDGSHKTTNVASVPGAMAELCGIQTLKGAMPPNLGTGEALQALALEAWRARARVRFLAHRKAEKIAGNRVVYSAVVFDGLDAG